jgi:ketosteroid isomerase-like protein
MDQAKVRVVAAWHAALNAGEIDRLLSLTHPDVEIGGPRGTARGTDVLREWVGRANIRLDPRRLFARNGTVVVEQGAEWRDAETGAVTGRDTVASVFAVRAGQVAQVARYPDLAQALAAADLADGDEVRSEGNPEPSGGAGDPRVRPGPG